MKKFGLIVIILLVVIVFSSCNCSAYEKRGIEEYDEANSSVSISVDLLPSDDYITRFEYVQGDYYYIHKGGRVFSVRDEQEIMYLVYEDDIYELAKDFVFEKILFSETHKHSYNGYEFIENICRREGVDPNVVNSYYPYWFNMVAFNDEKNTIVFMGFYMPEELRTPEVKQLLTFEDMGAFLKEYFSFYDFDA